MAAVGEHASFIGRPRLEVDMDVLAYYVDHCFTVKQMSHMLGVSLRTVERRLQTYDLSIREQYSAVCDDELSTFIAPLLNGNPQLGNKSIHSRIRAHGWRVQRFRVRDIVSRLRGDMGIAPNRTVRRRAYEVPGPLHLWHIDGNHKLVRWRFVIHGGVDGFSRLIVFIGISNNNRASTVMNLFKSAVVNWGLPLRVRSDKGYENADVAMYMLEKRGVGRGSFITGKSVHNTRIERLWRDVFDQCTGPFYNLFWQLEQSNVLNPDSDIDLFALHYVFLPVLMQEIAAFQESWNRHGLRTEGNQTPLQLFIGGLEIDGGIYLAPNVNRLSDSFNDSKLVIFGGYGRPYTTVTVMSQYYSNYCCKRFKPISVRIEYADWVTGEKIIIDSSGDRRQDFSLLNLASTGCYINAINIVYDVTANQRLSSSMVDLAEIVWGNGKTGWQNKPTDNPACGFLNENCPNYGLYIGVPVAVVILAALAAGVFFAIRHRQFEKNLNSMVWKINRELLQFGSTRDNMRTLLTSRRQSIPVSTNDSSPSRSTLGSRSLRLQAAGGAGTDEADGGGGRGDDGLSLGNVSQLAGGASGQTFIETAIYQQTQLVAVKKLDTKRRLNVSRELMIEMLHMTQLQHHNLATFIGATTEPPDMYVVWEYCAKGSLQDIIWDEKITLDNMFKFSIVIDVLKGLKYIHDSPLKLHGRLKSSNVLVDGRWTCKLSDFGLVKFREALDITTTTQNITEDRRYTQLLWTAPELLRSLNHEGRRVSALSASKGDTQRRKRQVTMSPEGDVYACAVILKEVFARNGPYTEYEDTSSREIIERIRDVPVHNSVALMRPVLPDMEDRNLEKLLGIMRSGWCERPQDRPTVAQMLKEVERINPFKSANVVDNMIRMMERYSNHLEEMVEEKTVQVAEEKRKSEALLYRMLPVFVAEKLKIGEFVPAEDFEAVTIYFSDIVKFTNLSAESTPMQVVALLNGLYTVFDSTIARHDVYKVETIGDAYMLVSGLPLRNGDRHAVEIANCAMELLSGVSNFKVAHKPDYKLQIRIGLHSGPVVAGIVGLTMPRYCLFGRTVGHASSMESGGMPMRIHVSEQLYQVLSRFPGYHTALRGSVVELTGIGVIKSYWLYHRDGYDRPLPNFSEQILEDSPQPEILPVTSGVPPSVNETGSTPPFNATFSTTTAGKRTVNIKEGRTTVEDGREVEKSTVEVKRTGPQNLMPGIESMDSICCNDKQGIGGKQETGEEYINGKAEVKYDNRETQSLEDVHRSLELSGKCFGKDRLAWMGDVNGNRDVVVMEVNGMAESDEQRRRHRSRLRKHRRHNSADVTLDGRDQPKLPTNEVEGKTKSHHSRHWKHRRHRSAGVENENSDAEGDGSLGTPQKDGTHRCHIHHRWRLRNNLVDASEHGLDGENTEGMEVVERVKPVESDERWKEHHHHRKHHGRRHKSDKSGELERNGVYGVIREHSSRRQHHRKKENGLPQDQENISHASSVYVWE